MPRVAKKRVSRFCPVFQSLVPSSSVAQGSYQRNALVIAIVQLLQLSGSVNLFSKTAVQVNGGLSRTQPTNSFYQRDSFDTPMR